MAIINLVTGEVLTYPSGLDPDQTAGSGNMMMSAVADALNKRQRFDFVWATQTQQDNQLGMMQGSRGYRTDLKSEWTFDGGAWRLATPYIQYGGAAYPATGDAGTPLGGWTVDNSRSTDTTLVTVTGHEIKFHKAGLYSVTVLGSGGGTTNSCQILSTSATYGQAIEAIAPHVAGVNQLVVPALRMMVDNASAWLWARYTNSGMGNRKLHISRLA